MIFGRHTQLAAATIVAVFAALGVMSVPAQDRPGERGPVLKVEGSASSLAFAPDGKTLACDLVLRNLPAGKEVARGEVGKDAPECTCVAFSPDGKRLASVHFDTGLIDARHAIRLWGRHRGQQTAPGDDTVACKTSEFCLQGLVVLSDLLPRRKNARH